MSDSAGRGRPRKHPACPQCVKIVKTWPKDDLKKAGYTRIYPIGPKPEHQQTEMCPKCYGRIYGKKSANSLQSSLSATNNNIVTPQAIAATVAVAAPLPTIEETNIADESDILFGANASLFSDGNAQDNIFAESSCASAFETFFPNTQATPTYGARPRIRVQFMHLKYGLSYMTVKVPGYGQDPARNGVGRRGKAADNIANFCMGVEKVCTDEIPQVLWAGYGAVEKLAASLLVRWWRRCARAKCITNTSAFYNKQLCIVAPETHAKLKAQKDLLHIVAAAANAAFANAVDMKHPGNDSSPRKQYINLRLPSQVYFNALDGHGTLEDGTHFKVGNTVSVASGSGFALDHMWQTKDDVDSERLQYPYVHIPNVAESDAVLDRACKPDPVHGLFKNSITQKQKWPVTNTYIDNIADVLNTIDDCWQYPSYESLGISRHVAETNCVLTEYNVLQCNIFAHAGALEFLTTYCTCCTIAEFVSDDDKHAVQKPRAWHKNNGKHVNHVHKLLSMKDGQAQLNVTEPGKTALLMLVGKRVTVRFYKSIMTILPDKSKQFFWGGATGLSTIKT